MVRKNRVDWLMPVVWGGLIAVCVGFWVAAYLAVARVTGLWPW